MVAEMTRFQNTYGHPRYCPERRHNIFAQPQYGTEGGYCSTSCWPSATAKDPTQSHGGWYFKGFYFVGAPGRTGLRSGAPGFPMIRTHPVYNVRRPITNGHTAYIKYLSENGMFDTGGDTCSNSSCIGWDLDRSEGVWEECLLGARRSAHAIFFAGGMWDESKPAVTRACTGTQQCPRCQSCPAGFFLNPRKHHAFNPENGYSPASGYSLETMWQHNCSTCTGKVNYHPRVGFGSLDEGPDDVYADPANPWSFSISMMYATYLNTSTFNSSAYNASIDARMDAFCQEKNYSASTCQSLVTNFNIQYRTEHDLSAGYTPSNLGKFGTVSGRWDLLISRGIHLHQPPENWGTSFEPTKTLVRGTSAEFNLRGTFILDRKTTCRDRLLLVGK